MKGTVRRGVMRSVIAYITWTVLLSYVKFIVGQSTSNATEAPGKFALNFHVYRSGNDVTATWDKINQIVVDITIRVCPAMVQCTGTNTKVIVVENLAATSAEFTVESDTVYVYSMVVNNGLRHYTSGPVLAEIAQTPAIAIPGIIAIAVSASCVLIALVVVLIVCLRRRFNKLKGQYAFTDMDANNRPRKTLQEVTSSADIKGVLTLRDGRYTILDDQADVIVNGIPEIVHEDATIDLDDVGDNVDGRLEIDTRPAPGYQPALQAKTTKAEIRTDGYDKPKHLSMVRSGDSRDDTDKKVDLANERKNRGVSLQQIVFGEQLETEIQPKLESLPKSTELQENRSLPTSITIDSDSEDVGSEPFPSIHLETNKSNEEPDIEVETDFEIDGVFSPERQIEKAPDTESLHSKTSSNLSSSSSSYSSSSYSSSSNHSAPNSVPNSASEAVTAPEVANIDDDDVNTNISETDTENMVDRIDSPIEVDSVIDV